MGQVVKAVLEDDGCSRQTALRQSVSIRKHS